MPRIETLEIEGFRCFSALRLTGLSPVTVLVGRNNAGKSAVLEAVEAVASEGSPFALYRASVERGEFRRRPEIGENVGGVWVPTERLLIDLRHWFHGHAVSAGARLSIRSTGDRDRHLSRSIELAPVDPSANPTGVVLRLDPPLRGQDAVSRMPLASDGRLGAPESGRFMEYGKTLDPPVVFVTTDRMTANELQRLWDGIALTPNEDRVLESVRLVDAAIERVAILGGPGGSYVQVRLRGESAPVPLGTLGEGVARVLTLALQLVTARGGVLLIDEVETGLHWSVEADVWRFLVRAALELDVQVFATTHSRDCLESLVSLPSELASRVSVHRLQPGAETSVRFDVSQLADYLAMEMEAR